MQEGDIQSCSALIIKARRVTAAVKEHIVLQMENIHKSFPGVRALQGVDFSLCEGEIHALMGENGAGKSTLIIFMAFHICERRHPDYYAFDMLSDLLSSGRSCRLVQHLVQEKQVFNSIDAYISGSIDEGLFHITGKPAPGVTLEAAEAAVWQELKALTEESVDEDELEKVKNRYESEQIFNNLNYLNVATNLAYFELTGKAEDINNEVNKYRSVTAGQIKEAAQKTFVRENCSTLYYKSNLPT